MRDSERDRLFQSINMDWYNLSRIDSETGLPIPNQKVPYALYHCHPISSETVAEIKTASAAVGRVLMNTWSIVRTLDRTTLYKYGFPLPTIDLIKHDPLAPFCMRLDWCWNEVTGVKKVIETNPQTPSFWFECTTGNNKVAQYFNQIPLEPNADNLLALLLEKYLEKSALHLGKKLSNCHVAFTTLNNSEDMGTMNWLSSHYDDETSVFPLEDLRIKDGKGLFNYNTDERIDILFMWYPIEWVINDVDENGQNLWQGLTELIFQKKVVIVNFASAFALQPKSIFALINELKDSCYDRQDKDTISNYFPRTSQSPETIGNSYFAKPILGRQGEGGFAVENGNVTTRSHNNNSWYTNQNYIYQELLDFPQVEIDGRLMTATWGAWLYNNSQDILVPGSVGMRVSEGKITDDYSYWCPIGGKEY
jgi:glutathionylspermidine synthase